MDHNKYFVDLVKAANGHDTEAQHTLSTLYMLDFHYKLVYKSDGFIDFFIKSMKSTEKTEVWSIIHLSYMYKLGHGVSRNYKKAFELRQLAVTVDPTNGHATYLLSMMYDNGVGVLQNKEMAVKLCEQAVQYGSSHAMYIMALSYECADGVEYNEGLSLEMLEKAVGHGSVYAMIAMAQSCHQGDTKWIPQDVDKAVALFNAAIKTSESYGMDSPFSTCCIADMYNDKKLPQHIHNPTNVEKAKKMYESAIISYWKLVDLGNPDAMTELADRYKDGEGVEQDHSKAVMLYSKAIDLDDDESMVELADMYKDGLYVEQSDDRAIELYKRAVELNNTDAMCALAAIDESNSDFDSAISLYEKAIINGNSNALYHLAQLYAWLDSPNEAIVLYNKSIQRHDTDSMCALADLYANMGGEHFDKIVPLYEEAIETDPECVDAMVGLGKIYNGFHGFPHINHEKAIILYKKAIEIDPDCEATPELARMYLGGTFVARDYGEAIQIYAKSDEYYDEAYGLIESIFTGKIAGVSLTPDILEIIKDFPFKVENTMQGLLMFQKLLKTNIDLLEVHFKYSMDGDGFQKAKSDFFNLILKTT